MRNKDKKNGFTLIEVLVAMAIFSTAIMVAFTIFISSQNLQQRTLAIQRGQSDARYALELIARKFRLGEIDYEYYEGEVLNIPESVLALRDSNGLPVRFQLSEEAIQICTQFSQEGISTIQSESCESWSDITPSNITIDRLAFYIYPTKSPYYLYPQTGEYYGGDYQEILTIVLENTISQVKSEDYQTKFQTSISSRIYKR